jgi:hypothetical protein
MTIYIIFITDRRHKKCLDGQTDCTLSKKLVTTLWSTLLPLWKKRLFAYWIRIWHTSLSENSLRRSLVGSKSSIAFIVMTPQLWLHYRTPKKISITEKHTTIRGTSIHDWKNNLRISLSWHVRKHHLKFLKVRFISFKNLLP